MKLKLKKVRLSFANLWTPEEFTKGDGKFRYGCNLLVPKDDPQIASVKSAIKEAGVEKFGQKFLDKKFRAGVKLHSFRDGDTMSYDGYEGMMFISANRAAKQGAPAVLDWDKTPLSEGAGRPYSGCYVNAVVEFYGDNRHGNAVHCSLIGVQFAGHGESFGGGARLSDDDFDVEEDAIEEAEYETEEYEAETSVDGEWTDDDPLG